MIKLHDFFLYRLKANYRRGDVMQQSVQRTKVSFLERDIL